MAKKPVKKPAKKSTTKIKSNNAKPRKATISSDPRMEHFQTLRTGLSQLVEARSVRLRKSSPHRVPLGASSDIDSFVLPGQPLDRELLEFSPVFLRSRKLFLEQGGIFESALVTSPRSLSSVSLVSEKIQYSPIEDELLWAATDAVENQNIDHLMMLITFTTSLFHEQNHRILWNFLPPPPQDQDGLRKYLNFAESLVIAADMALGDQLFDLVGPEFVQTSYLTGSTYDPGTSVMSELKAYAKTLHKGAKADERAQRLYRNYLHAAVDGTYLHLELYNSENIEKALQGLYSGLVLGKSESQEKLNFALRAARRSSNLDPMFINLTNPQWQENNWQAVIEALAPPHKTQKQEPLLLSEDPIDNRVSYIYAEKFFELIGL